MKKYDAIVLGGGPGGYECAIRLRQNGKSTALIEEDLLGGTCLNRGCIPTKALLHSAEIYCQSKSAKEFGVSTGEVSFDYASMVDRKNKVSAQLRKGIEFLEKNHGVEIIKAHGILSDAHTIDLSTGEQIQADTIVLATGSLPVIFRIPGADLPGVVDSTGLLDLRECPKKIVIVGGGVIGIEFATFFSRLGVEVSIIEMLDRILGPLDKDVADFTATELKKHGVNIYTGVKVESIEKGLKVNFSSVADGKKDFAEGDVVLMAGGRKPRTADIGLEKVGVLLSKRGFVEVDGLCRTNIPGLYAIGDITGKLQLAHVASAQGLIVADYVAGKTVKKLDMNHVPSCVYCNPEISMVGMTEDQAKATGREIGVGIFNLSGNGKAMTMGENQGFVKMIFDKKTDEIMGCHIVGPHATDMIAEVVSTMESEGTVTELGRAVHPHPTVSESVMEAAHMCHGTCVNAVAPRK